MMDDAISRKAALNALLELIEERQKWVSDASKQINGIDAAYCKICDLPAAQPKIGKWIYVRKRLVRGGTVDASECSICHKRIMPHLKPDYCPNCGAKMEEEDGTVN